METKAEKMDDMAVEVNKGSLAAGSSLIAAWCRWRRTRSRWRRSCRRPRPAPTRALRHYASLVLVKKLHTSNSYLQTRRSSEFDVCSFAEHCALSVCSYVDKGNIPGPKQDRKVVNIYTRVILCTLAILNCKYDIHSMTREFKLITCTGA
jgi:hypothetical protein